MYRILISQLRHNRVLIPLLVSMVIAVEAWGLVPYMTQHDPYPDYYYFMLPYVYTCDPLDIDTGRNHIKWWINCVSFQLTGFPNFLPLVFNIGVMPLTYLLAVTLTKDRIIGLIALTVLINNPLYVDWATSGTYDMAWAFFGLSSIILLYKNKGVISGLFFILAGMAKGLFFLYMPAYIYSSIKQRQFVPLVMISIAIAIGLTAINGNIATIAGNSIGFYPEHIEDAVFRNISLLWQVIPVLMALGGLAAVFYTKHRPSHFKDVIIWMLWIIATTPVIHLFSEQLTFTYRFVILGVFMSIFAGQTVVMLGNFVVESEIKLLNKH